MSKAIKQHWVPQFYLSAFTTSKHSGRICVTDIKKAYQGGKFRSTKRVSDVACQNHLYSLPPDAGGFQFNKPSGKAWNDDVDKFLHELETNAGHIWKKLQECPESLNLSPDSVDRKTLVAFLASLHLRNPRMIPVAKLAKNAATSCEVSPPITPEEIDAFHEAVDGVSVDKFDTLNGIRDRREFLAAQLLQLPGTIDVLNALHWTVHLFKGNAMAGPLVTSDTPIFCVDLKTLGPSIIGEANGTVVCPLTSRTLLIAHPASTNNANGAFVEGTKELEKCINPLIVHYGSEEAYSGIELADDFPFLRDSPTENK